MASGQENIGLARPLFELRGPLAKIDLSAWLSGISYFLGINMIRISAFEMTLRQSTLALFIILSGVISFFVVTGLLQKFIGVRLLSNEYGKPKRLVTDGPFAYSRNPIYVAFFIPLLSLAIVSPIASVVAIVFYTLSMTYTVLRIEERDLLARFGEDYREYASKVRRWI